MIVYNVTVKVDLDIHSQWKQWMLENHIQEVINTGCFSSCRISRLLAQNEDEGITYSLQYLSPSMKAFHRYQARHAPKLRQQHHEKFGDKAVSFRTMMEVVDEFHS